MKVFTGHSDCRDIDKAIETACKDFVDAKPELVIFFSDSDRFEDFSRKLNIKFPGSTVLGSSTFASFSKEGYSRAAINIAAISEGIRVSAGLIRDISRSLSGIYQVEIVEALEKIGFDDISKDNTCCFILNPAGTSSEERVLDAVTASLRNYNIPVVGGSASSEICLSGAVSYNGDVFVNSSIYAMIHLEEGSINIVLENIFQPMGHEHIVTKTDIENRVLYELDNEPACDVLCRDLNVSREGLADALALHPFGRIPKGKLFIDEVEKINEDGGISTYCRILDRSKLVLLEPCNLEKTMADTRKRLRETMGQVDFSIIVNCYSRTQLYLNNGWMDKFTKGMNETLGTYIGFTSHGELLDDFLLNLSLIMISFGSRGK